MKTSDFKLILPADFDDYEGEWQTKGAFSEAHLVVSGKSFRLSFYDPVRLAQEIQSEFKRGVAFFEPNLMVVPTITRAEMERAGEMLVQSQRVSSLAAAETGPGTN